MSSVPPRPPRRVPRRVPLRALRCALALGLALVTAACSTGTAGTTAATGTATRQVVDADGTTMQVPVSPRRVVVLSEPTLDGALALGVTPVGTLSGRGQSTVPHYLDDLASQIPVLGSVGEPDYEAVAAADPDLVLVDGTSINDDPDALQILRAVAPTYVTGPAGGDWRENFTHVGDALGLADEAAQVLADYDDAAAAAAARLTAYDGATFSIVRWQGSSASVILDELPPGAALDDLGLARPEAQSGSGPGHSVPVSLENLQDIDADYMFFGTLGGSSTGNTQAGGTSDVEGARQALAEAVKVPGFTRLTAYSEGHVMLVDGSLWTSTGGPLLMSRLVDSVLEELA